MLNEIRKAIESANINFLIGAGLSRPFLDVLNNIETFLSDPTKTAREITDKKKEYFDKVMLGNLAILDNATNATKTEVLSNYKSFYKLLNNILLKRENSLLSKQINIFTTNIDIFSEMALEETGIEFNDGFHGRFQPIFHLGNFKKSYFSKSLHYENTSEIPVFNILKLHGSLTWKYNPSGDQIFLDQNLSSIRLIKENATTSKFNKLYDRLVIVNPTKEKFKDTLLKQYYYDLLRIYSNELEKENSLLFVLGCSFADEHIRDLTARVANSNPTLKIIIFSHDSPSSIYQQMMDRAKNSNIQVMVPETGKKYDFKAINAEILSKIVLQPQDLSGDPGITPTTL